MSSGTYLVTLLILSYLLAYIKNKSRPTNKEHRLSRSSRYNEAFSGDQPRWYDLKPRCSWYPCFQSSARDGGHRGSPKSRSLHRTQFLSDCVAFLEKFHVYPVTSFLLGPTYLLWSALNLCSLYRPRRWRYISGFQAATTATTTEWYNACLHPDGHRVVPGLGTISERQKGIKLGLKFLKHLDICWTDMTVTVSQCQEITEPLREA